MVIVDTTVWVDYLRGLQNKETDYFDRELGRQRFGLTDLILCETLQGIGDENTFIRVLRELRKFEVFETGGEELAVEAARNFGNLRQRGRTVRKTDRLLDCHVLPPSRAFAITPGPRLRSFRGFSGPGSDSPLKLIREHRSTALPRKAPDGP